MKSLVCLIFICGFISVKAEETVKFEELKTINPEHTKLSTLKKGDLKILKKILKTEFQDIKIKELLS